MKIAAFFSILVLLLVSCKKDIAPGVPGCIKSEINANKDNPDWEVGSVSEYVFQGQVVYAFAPDWNIVSDGSTPIKDVSCNTICTIGGFGGPAINECNGQNFYDYAVFKRNIWTK